jgi:uncharacterized protein (TIGR00725 family)
MPPVCRTGSRKPGRMLTSPSPLPDSKTRSSRRLRFLSSPSSDRLFDKSRMEPATILHWQVWGYQVRYVVGVMGPAKARKKDVDNARVLGELIARREWVLLTGGRDVGVMHAANQGAKKVPRSLTVGVLPTTRDRISKYVDVAIITEMGNARNNVCVLSSQVIVACGLGGAGTVSEVALALKAGKEVVLLGATPVEEKFFKNLGGRLISSVQTAEDAINAILRRFERGNISTLQAPQPWGAC